jgi:lipooligosaccharide transport system ATP-binding protein
MVMSESAIETTGLTKHYGSKVAVDGIDLRVDRGTCVGVVGRNGAGKSTTMRMLTTVTRPTSGRLSILGLSSVDDAKRIKSRLGVVPQTNNLDEDLTVSQNLQIYSRYFRMGRRASRRVAAEAIELARLSAKADTPVSTLSGGMKRRLAIARAMVNDPEILLLDEPTAALDAQSKHSIWSTLGQMRAAGKTILIMSHDMEEVEMLCDRVLIMEAGRFVVDGAPHELIERFCQPALLDIIVDDAMSFDWAQLLADSELQPRQSARGVVIEVRDPTASMERLRASSIKFTAATVRPSSLTDVFLRVTGHEAD